MTTQMLDIYKVCAVVATSGPDAMKVESDSQWLADFAVRVVNLVLYMPDRQANYFGKITEELYSMNCNQSYSSIFWGVAGGREGAS